ncbi:competence protein CoiA [Lentilactobacillus kosonis]|uniref:Competence protein CoiA n=1 Tax=Lentilactobacillus kosonis TaxID=2810561 RepID=A0A401FNS2_9LACO|nr:competence protein CoiA family protein [Lentilactobacillus kosonis]GAY74045.1 competence protein CoiA [Lentilactobacillus kosonis]
MLMAQENGKLILAVGAVRNGKYYCPQCGQLVILKNGKNRRPYFAHLPKAVKLEAESVYHKAGKQRLYNDMLKIKYSVQMEVVMNNKAQRADIYISNKALALEYQCSAISLKSVANRTLEYNNSGIKVWWILGDNYLNRRLTLATLQKFVRYKPECGFYLVFYSVRQSRYLLWSHIEEANGIFIYQVNRYQSLQECWRDWDDIQQIKPKLKLRKQEVSREAHRLQVNVMLKNQQYLELADLCYRCGYILTGAPIICHSISHRFYPIFYEVGLNFDLGCCLS